MSAKDLYHDVFIRALLKDGWTITHDPLTVKVGRTNLFIDVGAERVITAERSGERIAVEVKSFLSPSFVQDLKEALGQLLLYADALEDDLEEGDRLLYLAVRDRSYDRILSDDAGRMALAKRRLRLIVFDPNAEEITQWIS